MLSNTSPTFLCNCCLSVLNLGQFTSTCTTVFAATADGKHVLARLSSKEIKYYEVGKSDDAKAVSLAGLSTTRVPADEWREIFAEVWRRYRDYFYVSNMHGYDWTTLREKYRPLLDHVGSRADLNYVIAEMMKRGPSRTKGRRSAAR